MFQWQWLSIILWVFYFLESVFVLLLPSSFDAHPEKITNGVKGMSGVKFLFVDPKL
jgi:hypothetical protein